MKVRIVNHGPDEATITHVGLHVLLNDFRAAGEVIELPDKWRIGRAKPGFLAPGFEDFKIAPKLEPKEVGKKGLPI